ATSPSPTLTFWTLRSWHSLIERPSTRMTGAAAGPRRTSWEGNFMESTTRSSLMRLWKLGTRSMQPLCTRRYLSKRSVLARPLPS
ncbi:hypothetical protein C0993_004217, partial [Termitomyces sp. T159_Od127]